MSLPELMTETQAASLLGITPRILSYQRQRGLISFIKVGRKIRYTEEFIRVYLENMTCITDFKSQNPIK